MHKFVSLVGLPADDKKVNITIEGSQKAYNSMTPFAIPFVTKNRKTTNMLKNVRDEENPYLHPEPYGYLISDDVNKT